MTVRGGTLTLDHLLNERHQSVRAFGLERIIPVIQEDLRVHNAIVGSLYGDFCEFSSDSQRIAGGSDVGEMIDVDEFGRAPTQKVGTSASLGFPLRAMQYNLGWTSMWFKTHSVAEMAEQVENAKKAHLQRITRDTKRAMYLSSNYTFRDRLVTPVVDLAVKRFCNADSFPIPDGPNGEVYTAASHQHYTAEASLTAANLKIAVNTVIEHGHGNDPVLYINQADETAVSALTGFKEAKDDRLILGTHEDTAGIRKDMSVLNDRRIGYFHGATVWVKPWAIANYALIVDRADARKPLVMRTRDGSAPALVPEAEFEHFPLHAKYMSSEFGVGVYTRTNGAVHYFGGGSFVDPTIT